MYAKIAKLCLCAVILLQLGGSALAADDLHLLWDIPFGINDLDANALIGDMRSPETGEIEFLGCTVDGFIIGGTRNPRTNEREYSEVSINLGSAPLLLTEPAQTRFTPFLDKLNGLFEQLEQLYGEPTFVKFTLIDREIITHPVLLESIDEVTWETCDQLLSVYMIVGVQAGFGNVLLSGSIVPVGDSQVLWRVDFFDHLLQP